MTRLLLVRHAVTKLNEERRYLGITDPALSEKGKLQASALAKEFSQIQIDQIVSSDLLRTVKTAEKINGAQNTPLKLDSRLRELNFGQFEGLTYSEAQAEYPEMMSTWIDDYNIPPKGGESISSLSARTKSFLDEILKLDSQTTILIVAHGGTLREIFRILLDLPPEKHWAFQFDPASWSEVLLEPNSIIIKGINHTHHLSKENL